MKQHNTRWKDVWASSKRSESSRPKGAIFYELELWVGNHHLREIHPAAFVEQNPGAHRFLFDRMIERMEDHIRKGQWI